MSPISSSHQQLWWRDYSVERGFWMYTVSICQPSSAWTSKCWRWFWSNMNDQYIHVCMWSENCIYVIFCFCHAGLDTSVPSIIFLKNSKLQQFCSATALLSSGAMGQCYEQHSLQRMIAFYSVSVCFNTPLIRCSFFFKGCLNLWNVLNGGKFVGSFKAVRYLTQQHF